MIRIWFALPLLLALANCTGVQRQDDKPAGLDAGLSVQVLRGEGGNTQLRHGELLRLSERVELELSVATAAYVYVVLYAPAGESTILFPQQRPGQPPEPLQPGQRKRVVFEHPEQALKPPPADLRLLAVATKEPLGPALCTLLRLRCSETEPSGGNRGEKPPPPPPPPPVSKPVTEDRRPSPPGKEARNPACVSFIGASTSGTHTPALIVPLVLNYQTSPTL